VTNSSTASFDDLMSSRLLDVPDYQRGYAWEAEHLAEFWEDLDLIEPGGRHYTGTIVLRAHSQSVQDDSRQVPLDRFDVVDGQQRLTTCMLLLDRLYARLEKLNDDDVRSDRRRLITCTVDGVARPKLQLGVDLRDWWSHVVLDGQPSLQAPRLAAQARLSAAAAFLEARLDAQRAGMSDTEYRGWLRRLAGKVTNGLQFSLYVVGDDSEVGVIFETLNQRGKDLTELEKTKNYLLFLANQLEPGPRTALAASINSCWREIFTNLGTARLGPYYEDQLLRAHWLATENPRQAEWDKAKSIKRRFHRRRYATDKALLVKEVGGYAMSLRDASLAFRDIIIDGGMGSFTGYGADAAAVRRASRQLRQSGAVAVFVPLLIAARLRFPTDGAGYASLVDICERYSVRVFLINERRSNAGVTRLYSLAHALHKGGSINTAVAGVARRIGYFASDEQTCAELRNLRRNWYAKAGHKYFLYQYEVHRLSGVAPALGFDHFATGEFRVSTTEHVLPQNPPDDCWQTFSAEERERYKHCLGNLVLTYDNTVYSNHSFARKRDGVVSTEGTRSPCYRTSTLRQEQDLADLEDWTPEQVEKRQLLLADWAMQRWKVDFTLVETLGPPPEPVDDEDSVDEPDQMLGDAGTSTDEPFG